eukprot:CAMPEP_0202908948 /NCGR_PEP_ID=MMETSP1392-20130828/47727_1 /ASSEMBLY_ACC=CAM_ASM_000868 /TAXON_ID=225041 /ORGANISM="Chlamydomonas chlamydogama, Strain SAG 11-48b" /LENGTH=66 /DNA_ID=CAMNT_0049598503 /DNA_START=21 /DNA_END=218 /DNA_ORIENTATION=-
MNPAAHAAESLAESLRGLLVYLEGRLCSLSAAQLLSLLADLHACGGLTPPSTWLEAHEAAVQAACL